MPYPNTGDVYELTGGITVALGQCRRGGWWEGQVVASTNPSYPVGGYDLAISPSDIETGRRIEVERQTTDWIVEEVGAWQREKGWLDVLLKGAKLGEEAGEVIGALFKFSRGQDTVEHVAKEVGDVIIVLAGICDLLGIDLDDAIRSTWEHTKDRTWGSGAR